MNHPRQIDRNDVETLAEDARCLLMATADEAGAKVADARQRLAVALERGREIYDHVREQAIETADEAVLEHSDHAIAIARGVGALIGIVATRCCSRHRQDS